MDGAGRATAGSEVPPSLAVLVVVSLVLLVAWSFAIPIFEAPDENLHWQFARHLHDERTLPRFRPGFPEANSPPLYYLLIAPLARPTETPEVFVRADGRPGIVFNPDGTLSATPSKAFRNHSRDFDRFWPIRLARLVSVVLGLGAVVFCALAGREATGRAETGLLAGSLLAFLPMFTFRATSVSNDVLVATLSAATLLLVVRLVRRGYAQGRGAALAAAMAGAFLSKVNAIVLPFPVALALATERVPGRDRLRRAAFVLGLALLLVLPWTARNVVLYGDPLASAAMRNAVSALVVENPITSPYFRTVFPEVLSRSYVGVFGWMNFFLPEWIYSCYLVLALAAAAGLLRGLVAGGIDRRLVAVVSSIPLLSLAVVVKINLTFFQPQGRYLLPASAAIALLAALGVERLPGWRANATWALAAALCALNVYILTRLVVPGYWFAPDINI